jgi:hypothetical protein
MSEQQAEGAVYIVGGLIKTPFEMAEKRDFRGLEMRGDYKKWPKYLVRLSYYTMAIQRLRVAFRALKAGVYCRDKL